MPVRTEAEVSDLLLEAIANHAPALRTIGRLASPSDLEDTFKIIGVLASNVLDELALEWSMRG